MSVLQWHCTTVGMLIINAVASCCDSPTLHPRRTKQIIAVFLRTLSAGLLVRHVWPECKVIHEFALCATPSREFPTALRAVLTMAANTRGAAPSPFFHCNIGHKFALCAPCFLRSAVVLGLITGRTEQKYLQVRAFLC